VNQSADEELSEQEMARQTEQDAIYQMKRNVLKVGEAELFRRYTNLRDKQKIEEAQMALMLASEKRP
jgi:hypothetical protein